MTPETDREAGSTGAASAATPGGPEAPQPGSRRMPRWNKGELIDAPTFTRRNWFLLLGPALLSGGSAIGGGEWLMGPAVTARYGGAIMWLATLSILGQVVYNLEISRYTLYTGEPIFTGKFRTLPGPLFWLTIYLVLDFGAIFPYLAANAATPLAAVILGHIPGAEDWLLLKGLGIAVFLLAMVPLIFGGKIYNTLEGGHDRQDRRRPGLPAAPGGLPLEPRRPGSRSSAASSSSAPCRSGATTSTTSSSRWRAATACRPST